MHWILTQTNIKTTTDTAQTLQLSPEFFWTDEFAWQPLAQSEPIYTLTGAVIIEQGTKLGARPITLSGGWITRQTLLTLQDWAAVGNVFRLTHPDGRVFDVIFGKTALSDVRPIKRMRASDGQADDVFLATLHFLTV